MSHYSLSCLEATIDGPKDGHTMPSVDSRGPKEHLLVHCDRTPVKTRRDINAEICALESPDHALMNCVVSVLISQIPDFLDFFENELPQDRYFLAWLGLSRPPVAALRQVP